MRLWLIVCWLLLPVVVGAYHLGPGQQHMKRDQTAVAAQAARTAVQQEDWARAVEQFELALAALPPEDKELSLRLRLELAKAQMMDKRLPDAHAALKMLLDQLEPTNGSPPSDNREQLAGLSSAEYESLVRDTREALAQSQYYLTWLMRLEGLPREEWEPEIESARQLYRLLALQADDDNMAHKVVRYQQDLEATIRLARMDLGELQGLPLPSQ